MDFVDPLVMLTPSVRLRLPPGYAVCTYCLRLASAEADATINSAASSTFAGPTEKPPATYGRREQKYPAAMSAKPLTSMGHTQYLLYFSGC